MHQIVKPYDVVFTEEGPFAQTWHGLQTTVPKIALDGSNIKDVLCPVYELGIAADFKSALTTLPASVQEFMGPNPLTEWKSIVPDLTSRFDDEGKCLGAFQIHVAKKSYVIHQNRDIFDSTVGAARQVLGDNGFDVATVGTLGCYSQFFVSLAVRGETEGDGHAAFFNTVSSHNSLVASMVMLSMVRIVCMNTVQMAIQDAETTGNKSTIRHTANSKAFITPEAFAANLEAWRNEKAEYLALMKLAGGVKMTVDQFKSFAAGILCHADCKEMSTTIYNRVNDMVPLFQRGKGNRGETLADGFNAVTEYYTSGNGVGSASVKAAKRIATGTYGTANKTKEQALAAVRWLRDEPDTFKLVCDHGERLYAEKLSDESVGVVLN